MTVRGLFMRGISIGSNFVLLALVGPAGFGLLGVVRGLMALIGFTSEFGVGGPLLRKVGHPSRDEYAAMAGLQTILVGVSITIVVLATTVGHAFDVVPREWRGWLLVCVGSVALSSLGTGARVRLERELNYQRVAFADVSSVLIQNVGLLAFALAGHFALGVFVVQLAVLVYNNVLLFWWSPGPGPAFRPAAIRALLRESATFSAATVMSMVRENGLPLVIAHAFGLPAAGIWSFATRMGQLLQGTIEGFRIAAIPAAGQLRHDPPRLRALATASLRDAMRYAAPAAVLAVMCLPVLGKLLPRWETAVVVTQWYMAFFAVSALATVGLEPMGVAVRGPRVALTEQAAAVAAGCVALGALRAGGGTNLVLIGPAMSAAAVVSLLGTTDRRVWPEWRDPAMFAVAIVLGPSLVYAIAAALRFGSFIPAAMGSATLAAVFIVRRTSDRRNVPERPAAREGSAATRPAPVTPRTVPAE